MSNKNLFSVLAVILNHSIRFRLATREALKHLYHTVAGSRVVIRYSNRKLIHYYTHTHIHTQHM